LENESSKRRNEHTIR
jgi:hypothetical protein